MGKCGNCDLTKGINQVCNQCKKFMLSKNDEVIKSGLAYKKIFDAKEKS